MNLESNPESINLSADFCPDYFTDPVGTSEIIDTHFVHLGTNEIIDSNFNNNDTNDNFSLLYSTPLKYL